MKNKILTIAHTKGGVGKSTILVNIAIYLLSLGYKVRVADCDPNKISTFISKRRAKIKKLQNYSVAVISSLSNLDEFCSESFDGITVIDTAGVDCTLTRRAIEIGTLVVTPIAPSTTEFIGFATYKKVVSELKINTNKIKMLINQAHPLTTDFESFKEQINSPFKFFDTAIIRSKIIDDSLALGTGVVELPKVLNKKSNKYEEIKASVRFKALVNEIIEILGV